jgi:hypothetical protein
VADRLEKLREIGMLVCGIVLGMIGAHFIAPYFTLFVLVSYVVGIVIVVGAIILFMLSSR